MNKENTLASEKIQLRINKVKFPTPETITGIPCYADKSNTWTPRVKTVSLFHKGSTFYVSKRFRSKSTVSSPIYNEVQVGPNEFNTLYPMHELGFQKPKYKLIICSVRKLPKNKKTYRLFKVPQAEASKTTTLQAIRFQKTLCYMAGTEYVRSVSDIPLTFGYKSL